PGKTLPVVIERDGRTERLTILPGSRKETQPDGTEIEIGQIGITKLNKALLDSENPIFAPWDGLRATWGWTKLTILGIAKMITREISADNIGGPLTIAKISGDAASQGFSNYIFLIAILSINLGVLNLLPVPVLDGGHLAFFTLNAAGAQEVLMPIASPAELWQETGRWDFYGKELFRFKDRHERDFCLGPTHEEVITDLVRREVRSYRQLPANFYQIQTKFRDEIRPRFGLMRGREFIMKDAYSFDADEAGAKESYRKMYEAYKAIFTRCGLTFRPVEADTGLIGGTSSHEFMVLADTGEEGIAVCDACDYAANVERAELVGTGVARAPVALANATGGGPPPVMQEHAHKPPADTLR